METASSGGSCEEELKSVNSLQPASPACKEVTDFVVANSDPLIPITQKKRKSRRFWKWLSGLSCFSFSWICCCCYSLCPLHLELPCSCCDCGSCGSCKSCGSCRCKCKSCFQCSVPKPRCCSCPQSNCCKEVKDCIQSCCCCCSCSCNCSFWIPSCQIPSCRIPSCPTSNCCRFRCSWPKCPKLKSDCFTCKGTCCSCSSCYICY